MDRDRFKSTLERGWERVVMLFAFLVMSSGLLLPAALPVLWVGDGFRQKGQFNGLLALIIWIVGWAALATLFYYKMWRIPSLEELTSKGSSGSSGSSGKKLINLAILVGLVITAGVFVAKARKSSSELRRSVIQALSTVSLRRAELFG